MAVVITSFERYMETVNIIREKMGLDPAHPDEIPVYYDAYKDDVDAEQAVREDACL